MRVVKSTLTRQEWLNRYPVLDKPIEPTFDVEKSQNWWAEKYGNRDEFTNQWIEECKRHQQKLSEHNKRKTLDIESKAEVKEKTKTKTKRKTKKAE